MDAAGMVTTIDFPGASSTSIWNTNNACELVGSYTLASDPFPFPRAMTRDASGVFTPVIVPFAGAFAGGAAGEVFGNNDRGDLCGYWLDNAFIGHGYVRDAAGVFTAIDLPTSCTALGGINNRRVSVGTILDGNCSSVRASMLWTPAGALQPFVIPAPLTGGRFFSINDHGDLTGIGGAGQPVIAWRM
jgi:hypothetical protein